MTASHISDAAVDAAEEEMEDSRGDWRDDLRRALAAALPRLLRDLAATPRFAEAAGDLMFISHELERAAK